MEGRGDIELQVEFLPTMGVVNSTGEYHGFGECINGFEAGGSFGRGVEIAKPFCIQGFPSDIIR